VREKGGSVSDGERELLELVEQWRRSVESEPTSAASHANLGTTLLRLGRTREAEEELRRALQLRKDFPEALVNLGGILLSRWDHRGCIEANRKAASLKPGFLLAHYNEGLGHLYLGEPEAMVACFRRVLQLDERHAGGHYYLAVGLLALKNVAESRAHLDAALKEGFSPAPEFLKALERAEGGPKPSDTSSKPTGEPAPQQVRT
jgi:tetratricopeptide (TPR) repeat protein